MDPHPVILFDGVCNLCDRWVHRVIRHDRAAQFRFAALQSPVGRRLMQEHGLDPDDLGTMVLIDGDTAYQRSDAAVRIARRLGGGWRLLSLVGWLPRPLRDPFYNFVASNRYRWFGRKDACLVPSDELAERFLE